MESETVDNSSFSFRFDLDDLRIRSYGFNYQPEPHLFMNIFDTAGGSIPTNSEQLFSYLFYTNDGIYAVTFAEGAKSYGVARIAIDENKCITSSKNEGKLSLQGNWLNVTDMGPGLNQVFNVETVQFNMDDEQTCIVHVFDFADRK